VIKNVLLGAVLAWIGAGWMAGCDSGGQAVPFVMVSGGVSVEVGQTVQLTATTREGDDPGYTWTSSNPGVATVDATGLVTGVGAGDVTLTAEGESTGARGSWGVHVFEVAEPTPTVTLSGDSAVPVGGSLQLLATTADGTDSGYTWESSDAGVATVDATGLVTGVAEGQTFIRATGLDTGATGRWGVYVYLLPGPIPAVSVSGAFSVLVGGALQLSAATTDGTDSGYTWASLDEAIATVDAAGLVTGVAQGEVIITATGADTGAVGRLGVVVMEEALAVPFEEQWASSGHADAASEAFRHWDADGSIPTGCAKCHGGFGFEDFLGVDGTAPGAVDNAAALGSVIGCTACHNAATLTKDSVTFPSGDQVAGLGREATCLECHSGRESTTSVDAAIATAAPADDDAIMAGVGFKNIHYAIAGVSQFGGEARGAYQYSGKSYDRRFAHVEEVQGCSACHDAHTLEIRLENCTTCHAEVVAVEDFREVRMAGSLVDYDGDGDIVEGVAGEITGLQEKLYQAIQAYAVEVLGAPIAYTPASHPYFFIDTNGNGLADPDEAVSANKYVAWSARLLRAAFNYQYSLKDPAAYAHGGKYAIEVLFDSIEDLNSRLGAPVDLSGASRTDVGHFDGSSEAWRHWDEDGEVSASCALCHSATGLPTYLAFRMNAVAEPAPSMACATCHDPESGFGPRAVASVIFPSGVELDSGVNGTNLCMTCHKGRESGVSIENAVTGLPEDEVAASLRFVNVHYAAAGAVRYGEQAHSGYQYPGLLYDGYFAHVDGYQQCADCHDVHAQELKLGECSSCHAGATDLVSLQAIRMPGSVQDHDGDGDTSEGIAAEIDGLRAIVYSAMQAYATSVCGTGIVYDAHTNPYFFLDTNGNGLADTDEVVSANRFNRWTPRLLKAGFNYQFATKDLGAFAHNAKYVLELLYDSAADLGGVVSVDLTNAARNDQGHFDPTAEAWRHWDADGEVPGSCARCHAVPAGLDAYLASGVDSAEPFPPSPYGMTCNTCHQADMALKVASQVTFPGGTQITDGDTPNPSFLCMTCHQGRESKATIDAAIAGGTLGFRNVHYLPAGAVFYGADAHVGYEYDGHTYAARFNHAGPASQQCSFCHDVSSVTHGFGPIVDASCTGCHAEATAGDARSIRFNRALDYDGDGSNTEPLADEIAGLAGALMAAMQTHAGMGGNPLVYEGHTYPYFFIDTDGDGLADADELTYANRFTAWDEFLMKAAHNFQIAQKEPGAWAHNTHYTAQLLIDSMEDLGYDVSGFSRP